MAAEVYHITPGDKGIEGLQGRIVEEGATFYVLGYGDGSGYETFVRVREGGVHIFSGASEPYEGSNGPRTRVRQHEDIAMLQPGDPAHTDTLVGPENNNKVFLYVRNIGETAARPYMHRLPISDEHPPLATSFN